MLFSIEMSRTGEDGTTLVTLCDGDRPKIGATFFDGVGNRWRIVAYRRSEVCVRPLRVDQNPPKVLMDEADFIGIGGNPKAA